MGADDLSAVRTLASQLGYPATMPELSDRFESLRHSPLHGLFVAAPASGSPAGFLHVIASAALIHGPEAEIVSLVVDDAARNRGIGAALIAAAETWARSRGLISIRVRCRIERAGAHRLYAREGFERTKTQHVFAKPLAAAGVR